MEGMSESAYTQKPNTVGRRDVRRRRIRRTREPAPDISSPRRRFFIVSAFCCAVEQIISGFGSIVRRRGRRRTDTFGGGICHDGEGEGLSTLREARHVRGHFGIPSTDATVGRLPLRSGESLLILVLRPTFLMTLLARRVGLLFTKASL